MIPKVERGVASRGGGS